jgi:hypothetical protein
MLQRDGLISPLVHGRHKKDAPGRKPEHYGSHGNM